MRKFFVVTGIVTMALLGSASAEAAGTKIGVVDLNSAVQNTTSYQSGLKKLEALKNRKQKELIALQNQISQAEKDLLGQSMAMAPDRVAEKQQELTQLRKMFQRKQQDAQEELTSAKNSMDKAAFMDLMRAVKSYAAKEKFDLILPKSAVIHNVDALDVTGEITKLLDKSK